MVFLAIKQKSKISPYEHIINEVLSFLKETLIPSHMIHGNTHLEL